MNPISAPPAPPPAPPDAGPFCLALTTVPDEPQAQALAERLVRERLAACVQLVAIRSVYVWNDALCREPEWLLLIKTRSALWEALQAAVRRGHSYQTPELLRLPVDAGSPDYLAWLAAACRPAAPGGAG